MSGVRGTVVMVHPQDVNLADWKAVAADYDATVQASPYVQRGQFLLMNLDHTTHPAPTGEGESDERSAR